MSQTALAVAEKLLELGAIPISFSDPSGHVHEPQGFDLPKIKTMQRIKQERGATVGRYIMASTSARFNDPEHVFSIPCDFVFACAPHDKIDEQDINQLASNGCKGVIEGCHQAMTPSAIVTNRKKGLLHGPYRATTVGASLVNGITIAKYVVIITMLVACKFGDSYSHACSQPFLAGETLESRVESAINELYQEIKVTAKEFNARGDLMVGTNIAAFIRVANVMLVHGSV